MRLSLFLAAACLSGCLQPPPPPPAATAPPPELQQVMPRYNAGDTLGAVALLDSLVSTHPDSPQVLATLGTLRQRMGQWEEAADAFVQAATLNPAAGALSYNAGLSYAHLNRPGEALDWLEKARGAGFNVLNVAGTSAAGNLEGHPRYAALLPSPEQYANPFVEEVRILHDWTGEHAGDQFGWVARRVGDVDGDGVNDAAISATTNNEGAPAGGKVYLFSGGSGTLLWAAAGPNENGQLGFVVEDAGDVDGDGRHDVIAGAPYANKAWVYSGRSGLVLHELEGNTPNGAFGASVKGIGDVDADGFGDLLVGEPFQIWGGPVNGGPIDDPGRAHVFSGRDGRPLFSAVGEREGDAFGSTLAGASTEAGIVFAVGAPQAGDENRGKAYVYHGANAEPVRVLEPGETGVNFGAMFMSIMGDADADGTADIYVSDWADGTLGPSTGRIYVFSGADGHLLFQAVGENAGDGFGIGVSDAGDVNQDGHDDLIVGAWQYAGAAPSGGKLYVLSGTDGGVLRSITGNVMGETLGFDTTGMGDVDGDGVVDFLVTSAWSSRGGYLSGRTMILSGR